MRPWIGITTYNGDARLGASAGHVTLLPTAYAEAVNRAGGRAVLIPSTDADIDVLDRLDGLVLAGGSDVDPGRYGQAPHPATAWHPERDAAEFLLVRAALDRDLPVLGVCRGMQILVVEYGGSLHQHLPDELGHDGHRPPSGDGSAPSYGEQAVRIAPGTRLHTILGDHVEVRCRHHQGVADPGRLLPSGWNKADGLVEAAEDPDLRFVIGVQWHPEEMADPRVWDALIAAASVESGSRPAIGCTNEPARASDARTDLAQA